jgi:hypothetical protein
MVIAQLLIALVTLALVGLVEVRARRRARVQGAALDELLRGLGDLRVDIGRLAGDTQPSPPGPGELEHIELGTAAARAAEAPEGDHLPEPPAPASGPRATMLPPRRVKR